MAVQVTPFQGANPLRAVALGEEIRGREEQRNIQRDVVEQRQERLDANRLTEARNALPGVVAGLYEGLASLPEDQRMARYNTRLQAALPALQAGVRAGAYPPELLQELQNPTAEDLSGDPIQKLQKGSSAVIRRGDQEGFAMSMLDPRTGEVSMGFVPFEGDLVSDLGETAGERQRREVSTAREKEKAKQEEGRLGNAIDEGMLAADATSTTRRAIQLLQEGTPTGGFTATQLAVARRFGLEDPDLGELSNLLGKDVLSQLRSTFGAAFTENEGKRLADIEASLGNNPQTNLRLLNNALRMAERRVRRGIEAAERQGDDFALRQMQEAMQFQIGGNVAREIELREMIDAGQELTPEQQQELARLTRENVIE